MQLQPNFIFMGEMKLHVLEVPEGEKKHSPSSSNDKSVSVGIQGPDRRKQGEFHPRGSFGLTRKAFIFSLLFAFELRVDLSSHLLHGTEACALLQTNAEAFPIPRSIIYLAKYLNRIFHGRLIIATPVGQLQLRGYRFLPVCC